MTVGVTVHDKMSELRRKGVGGGHLRHRVRTRFETICRQYSINDPEKGRTVDFEFQHAYKSQEGIHQKIYGIGRSKLFYLPIGMELLIVDAQGVSQGF